MTLADIPLEVSTTIAPAMLFVAAKVAAIAIVSP